MHAVKTAKLSPCVVLAKSNGRILPTAWPEMGGGLPAGFALQDHDVCEMRFAGADEDPQVEPGWTRQVCCGKSSGTQSTQKLETAREEAVHDTTSCFSSRENSVGRPYTG